MKHIILIITFVLALLTISGCDGLTFTNSVHDADIVKTSEETIEETPDYLELIRDSYVEETLENLSSVNNQAELKKALLALDIVNSASLLRGILPDDIEKLTKGDLKQLLQAYSGLIATRYCVESKDIIDVKKLAMLDQDNAHALYNNIFVATNLKKTACLLSYWHFQNYRAADAVFSSASRNYSPFTQDEFTLVIWTKILQDWTKDKYKDEILQEMISMGMLEESDGKYLMTEQWKAKLKEDWESEKGRCSKINSKYNLGINLQDYFDRVVLQLNGKAKFPERGYCSSLGLGSHYGWSGGPGGGGGGFRYRRERLVPSIPADVLERFETERLLTYIEIRSLLNSSEIIKVFRGSIHLFRLMESRNDYFIIESIVPAINNGDWQLCDYVENKIARVIDEVKDAQNIYCIKKFLYSLFANQNKGKSRYLKYVFKFKDEEFTESFIDLLIAKKITDSSNQEMLIDYIVEKRLNKYIPALFNWRFLDDDNNSYYFIKCKDFFDKMIMLNRDLTLSESMRMMQMDSDDVDLDHLGEYCFEEITKLRICLYSGDITYYKIDSNILSDNFVYLQNINLIDNFELRRQFYFAVILNCDANFDDAICRWINGEDEKYYHLNHEFIICFVRNIFEFDTDNINQAVKFLFNSENGSAANIKRKIRTNEYRFLPIARIALEKNMFELHRLVFHVAPYMSADKGWQLITPILDKYNQDGNISYFFWFLDDLKPDEFELIEIGKQKQHLYKYLVNTLKSYKTLTLDCMIPALSILAK